ncbi:unnamed protein product [Arctogadus glacialis]
MQEGKGKTRGGDAERSSRWTRSQPAAVSAFLSPGRSSVGRTRTPEPPVGGEMTPSTIGSSADGVSGETGRTTGGASGQSAEEGTSTAPKTPSARVNERRGGRPGEVEAPDRSEAPRDGGVAAATASPKEPDDSSMEVMETRTSEEGEWKDYDAVKASRKRMNKKDKSQKSGRDDPSSIYGKLGFSFHYYYGYDNILK